MSDSASQVGVFISYHHEDVSIAVALRQSLLSLSSALKVFIDHAGIEPGDQYESVLAESIRSSQWFLLVCSGPPRPERNMGWCLYEAGQCRARLLETANGSGGRRRLVCLHDFDLPEPLKSFQSVKVRPQDRLGNTLDLRGDNRDIQCFENTELFSLLVKILTTSGDAPLAKIADADVRDLIRHATKTIIRAFTEMQSQARLPEVVLQPRISFHLVPSAPNAPTRLTPDTRIFGYEYSLSELFGIADSETTWGNIKQLQIEANGATPAWMEGVEAAAEQVSQELVPDQPSGPCFGRRDRKAYRVIFARYEPFRNRARICHVLFVAAPFRQFDLKQTTSILLCSLILSIRFRQRLLTFTKSLRTRSRSERIGDLIELERQLRAIEAEAEEFGLRSPRGFDGAPLANALQLAESKSFVRSEWSAWPQQRARLLRAIEKVKKTDAKEEVDQATRTAVGVLEEVYKVNGPFIKLLIEELAWAEEVTPTHATTGAQ